MSKYRAYYQTFDNLERTLEVTECDPPQHVVDVCVHLDSLTLEFIVDHPDGWVRVVSDPGIEPHKGGEPQ
jgi:hypothetical protein